MDKQYLSKAELTKRWSASLVQKYYPVCAKLEENPVCKRFKPMQLYDINRIRYIESLELFKEEWGKVLERRKLRLMKKQLKN